MDRCLKTFNQQKVFSLEFISTKCPWIRVLRKHLIDALLIKIPLKLGCCTNAEDP